MNGTIIQQGSFISNGAQFQFLSIRADADWMAVYNYTQMAAQNDVGVQYYWQRGMATGTGIINLKTNGGDALTALTIDAPFGFTLLDTSVQSLDVGTTIDQISNDVTPQLTSVDHGLKNGDIVRIYDVIGAEQLGGFDIFVTYISDDVVALEYLPQIAAALDPGVDALIRRVNNATYWYPYKNIITNITQAASGVVTFAAPHNLTIGQQVRFIVPAVKNSNAYGMTELNGESATITATSTVNNTITIDIDTTGFTAFAFPTTLDNRMQLAQVIPFGEDTAYALAQSENILLDSTENNAYIGMKLGGGVSAPGGDVDDVIYWVAGKSASIV
jgi:hypothetical protein